MVEPTATNPAIPAAMVNMPSNGLIERAAATGAGAVRGTGAEVAAVRGAADAGAAAARGAGAACVGGAAATGAGAAPPGTAGPPGGNVGSLIVGAAEGLGGKLIRTVSFLG